MAQKIYKIIFIKNLFVHNCLGEAAIILIAHDSECAAIQSLKGIWSGRDTRDYQILCQRKQKNNWRTKWTEQEWR